MKYLWGGLDKLSQSAGSNFPTNKNQWKSTFIEIVRKTEWHLNKKYEMNANFDENYSI